MRNIRRFAAAATVIAITAGFSPTVAQAKKVPTPNVSVYYGLADGPQTWVYDKATDRYVRCVGKKCPKVTRNRDRFGVYYGLRLMPGQRVVSAYASYQGYDYDAWVTQVWDTTVKLRLDAWATFQNGLDQVGFLARFASANVAIYDRKVDQAPVQSDKGGCLDDACQTGTLKMRL